MNGIKRMNSIVALAIGAFLSFGTYADVRTVASGETVTVTDADVGGYAGGFSFADKTGVIVFDTSSAPTMAIVGEGTVKKASAADWTMATSLPNFTGDYKLEGGGTVTAGIANPFGSTAAKTGIYVGDGTTLKVTATSAQFVDRTLHLAGTGVDDYGALYLPATIGGTGMTFLKHLTLEDDATIRVDGDPSSTYLYQQGSFGKVTLNGHTVTKTGTGNWIYSMNTLQDSGTLVIEGPADKSGRGCLAIKQWTTLGAADKLTVKTKNLVTIRFMDEQSSAQPCPLVVDGELEIYRNALPGSPVWTTTYAKWTGPISFANADSKIVVAPAADNVGYTLAGPITGPGSVGFTGKGYFCLSGSGDGYTGTSTYNGESGTWRIVDGSLVRVPCNDSASPFKIGTSGLKTSRMVVSNASLVATAVNVDSSSVVLKNAVALGTTAYAKGILEIEDGAIVSNKVAIGCIAKGVGALYQRGGTSVLYGDLADANYAKTAPLGVVANASGYLELSGGSMTFAGQMAVGTAGQGVFVQKGGSFVLTNHVTDTASATAVSLHIGGYNTFGEVLVEGGSFVVPKLRLGRQGGTGIMTVAGGDVVVKNEFRANEYAYSSSTYINLNGGTYSTPGLYRANASGNVYVNFNGGTWRCLEDGNAYGIFAKSAISATRVTVYAGGATIDTNGKSGNLSKLSFGAPTGKGVGSIPWTPKSGSYVGSPTVKITGDGTGATAHAVFDSATGTLTAIEVTSPGVDYTTATATVTYGGETYATIDLTDCLVEQESGPFTKAGAGTFLLSAANSWGGDTILRGGELKCTVDGAIPAGSRIVFAGGSLNLNGKKLSDGSSCPKKWAVDCGEVLAKGTATYAAAVDFSGGATIEIRNAESIDPATVKADLLAFTGTVTGVPTISGTVDPNYHVKWTGSKLKLAKNLGMLMIVR